MEIISVLMETSGKTTLVLLNTEIIHSLVVIKENQQHKFKKKRKNVLKGYLTRLSSPRIVIYSLCNDPWEFFYFSLPSGYVEFPKGDKLCGFVEMTQQSGLVVAETVP